MLEILVVVTLSAILMGVFSFVVPQTQRMATQFLDQFTFREQYLLFLALLQKDFENSILTQKEDWDRLEELTFRESAPLFSTEKIIRYRWNQSKLRIERKISDGAFQELLGGVKRFSWKSSQLFTGCFEMILIDSVTNNERHALFCRIDQSIK